MKRSDEWYEDRIDGFLKGASLVGWVRPLVLETAIEHHGMVLLLEACLSRVEGGWELSVQRKAKMITAVGFFGLEPVKFTKTDDALREQLGFHWADRVATLEMFFVRWLDDVRKELQTRWCTDNGCEEPL